MLTLAVRRILLGTGALLLVSIVVFLGVFVAGDPVATLLGPHATPHAIAQLHHDLALDRPWWQQYAAFLRSVLRGEVGASLVTREAAFPLVLSRLPATLELVAVAALVAGVVGTTAGFLAARRPGSWLDRGITTATIVGASLPTFWVGLVLILAYAVAFGTLPPLGRGAADTTAGFGAGFGAHDGWRHLWLPMLALALVPTASIARCVRCAVAAARLLPAVRFARAQGIPERRIFDVHVRRHVAPPLVARVGRELGRLVVWAGVVEAVFAWPGAGKLLVDSIVRTDAPVLVASLLIVAALLVAIDVVAALAGAQYDARPRRAAPRTLSVLRAAASASETPEAYRTPRPWREVFSTPAARIAVLVLAAAVVAALGAPWIAPIPIHLHDVAGSDAQAVALSPWSRDDTGRLLVFGTDAQGRDLFGAILLGLRTSLVVAIASVTLAFAFGATVGIAAVVAGGRTEAFITRLVALQRAVPGLLVALLLVAILGRGVAPVVIAIATALWVRFAQATHAAASLEMRRAYIAAARNLDLAPIRILIDHLLPNTLPRLVAVSLIAAAHAIILEATLSFLGVGLAPAQTSLGLLIAYGVTPMLHDAYAACVLPGLALLAVTASLNLVAARLRHGTDP